MTSTILTLTTESDLAKSFESVDILFTLTPGAGSSSNLVIMGPGDTETTSTSIPKSFNLSSTNLDIASSDSSEYPFSCIGGSSRSDKLGRSPSLGGSNIGTCLSFSALVLFSS